MRPRLVSPARVAALAALAVPLATDALPPRPARPLQARAELDTAAIDRAMRDEMAATRTPGAAIAVVRDARVVYAKGYGVRSVESAEPVTAATLFRIGSTTKMVTGLAALVLAAEGRVDLRAPIARVAPGLAAPFRALTLDQLLTHRAGLTNEAAADGPHDDEALARRVRAWGAEHVVAPPGDVYSYSGPGYWLAGHVIAQAGAAPYADVVAGRVLRPLGMTRSTFRPLAAMTWPLALDHRVGPDGATVLRPFPDDVTTWASGSLFSSADELARLAVALVDSGRVDGAPALPAAAVAAMHRAATTTPDGCGYSYGLSVCTRDGVRRLGHYGFRVGSGSVVALLPDSRSAVVILANRNGGIFARTEQAVLAQLAPPAGSAPAPTPQTGAPAAAAVPGTYANGADTLRLVAAPGGGLRYRYRADDHPARYDAARGELHVLDAQGRTVQEFGFVRGAGSGRWYLHDGLGAFARVR